MPCSACCSARVSGVAMLLLHLQLDQPVLDENGERFDRDVGRQVLRGAGPEVEPGAMARALDPAPLLIQLALQQDPIVMRAAVFDREELATAVDDRDLEVVPFHDAMTARGQLGHGADVDDVRHIRFLHSGLYPPPAAPGQGYAPRAGMSAYIGLRRMKPKASWRTGSSGSSG